MVEAKARDSHSINNPFKSKKPTDIPVQHMVWASLDFEVGNHVKSN